MPRPNQLASTQLENIQNLITQELKPLVRKIDEQGLYPRDFMHKLGELGGFAAVASSEFGGLGLGLAAQIQVTSQVAQACGSSAFIVWCQAACVGYLQKTANTYLQQEFLPAVAKGEVLCGTGMSNTVKHLAGIEKIHLKAQPTADGYLLQGALPWVSNLQEDGLLIAAAALEDASGYLMFLVPLNSVGLSMHACPDFSGMQGTATYSLRFEKVFINNNQLLATPANFNSYIDSIKQGFMLSQIGMGAGIIQAAINSIAQINFSLQHVNQFLDEQAEDLQAELDALVADVNLLAATESSQQLEVLRLRLRASELALKSVHAEVLHTGARGYLMSHGAQRRQREALFVAIVTPALKHLRKEIHRLENLAAAS